jgi:hypothetical protein
MTKDFRRIILLLFATAMLPLATAPSRAQNPETTFLNLETKIALGQVKGRIDHMALDPLRMRLFVAELENNSVGVVDLKERKVVHVIAGLTEPQGVGYEPSSDTLYVANGGDGSVRLYRGDDYAEAGRIDLGDDADNIRIDAGAKRILVGYGGGAIATIDPAARTKTAAFPLPAHPEGFQLDPKTKQIFVNVATCKEDRGARWRQWAVEGYMAHERGRREFSDGDRRGCPAYPGGVSGPRTSDF